ncbi:MAG: hypothetical protein AAF604_15115 [Acidobacteriota bacterium]
MRQRAFPFTLTAILLATLPAGADLDDCPLISNASSAVVCLTKAPFTLPGKTSSASDFEIHRAAAARLSAYELQALAPAKVRREVDRSGRFILTIEGQARTLILDPVSIVAPNLDALQGSPGRTATYRGRVADEPDSWVRLWLDDDLLFGAVQVAEQRWLIEPAYKFVAGGGTDRLLIYRDDSHHQEGGVGCGLQRLEVENAAIFGGVSPGGRGTAPPPLRVVELALDLDAEYQALHGPFVIGHALGVINLVSELYERDLDLMLKVVHIRFGNYQECEVWRSWCEVWDAWENTPALQAVDRDQVLLMSGRDVWRENFSGTIVRIRGFAGQIAATCVDRSQSYALTTNYREVGLVAHELGHLLGMLPHVAGPCPDGDCGLATCPDPDPAGGAVMCGAIQSPILGFVRDSQEAIGAFVETNGSCLEGSRITLENPDGGEFWPLGQPGLIEWSSAAVTGDVGIELSRDDGATWEVLFPATENDGVAAWTVTGPPTSLARLRISSLDLPGIAATSAARFSITGPPTAIVVAPNGGESWPQGSLQTLRWQANGVVGSVRIELSRDGGVSWEVLFASTANDGQQPWTVSGPATTNGLLRVTALSDPSVSDVSDATFSLGSLPTVLAPNGGEVWSVGQPQTIRWLPSPRGGSVQIELSRDDGASWSTLFAATQDDGVEEWTPTLPLSETARLRVTRLDGSGADVSDGTFALVGALVVLEPATGAILPGGSLQTIRWSSLGVTGNLRIELLRSLGTSSEVEVPEVLFATTPDDGAQIWGVTTPATTSARVRIVSLDDGRVVGLSGPFTITTGTTAAK